MSSECTSSEGRVHELRVHSSEGRVHQLRGQSAPALKAEGKHNHKPAISTLSQELLKGRSPSESHDRHSREGPAAQKR